MLQFDAFQGHLSPGERVIWSGRPGQGLMLTAQDVFLIPFSLLWCGFAVFWEWNVASAVHAWNFGVIWGAMFVCIGLYFVFGRFLVDAWVRSKTSYALTDQRALIKRSAPFPKFVALTLANLSEVAIEERSNGCGTIRLGQGGSAVGRRGMSSWSPALDARPQFLMIDDARRVFALVEQGNARRFAS